MRERTQGPARARGKWEDAGRLAPASHVPREGKHVGHVLGKLPGQTRAAALLAAPQALDQKEALNPSEKLPGKLLCAQTERNHENSHVTCVTPNDLFLTSPDLPR